MGVASSCFKSIAGLWKPGPSGPGSPTHFLTSGHGATLLAVLLEAGLQVGAELRHAGLVGNGGHQRAVEWVFGVEQHVVGLRIHAVAGELQVGILLTQAFFTCWSRGEVYQSAAGSSMLDCVT